jgi:hypothetical protein
MELLLTSLHVHPKSHRQPNKVKRKTRRIQHVELLKNTRRIDLDSLRQMEKRRMKRTMKKFLFLFLVLMELMKFEYVLDWWSFVKEDGDHQSK